MKKIIILLAVFYFSSIAYAGTPSDPDVNLFLGSNNISGSATTFRINVSTSFDPGPISSVLCGTPLTCRVVVEDCNGAINACETDTDNFPLNIIGDWNGIPTRQNFENDLNCSSNCTRFGVVEDTLQQFNLTTVSRGSRWIRACWIDGTFSKCSKVQRIHTYDESACRPPPNGNMVITARCVFKHPDNNFTAIPLVVFVDKNLIVTSTGQIELQGASIDFNSKSGTSPFSHRFQLNALSGTFSRIFQTGLGYFDTNLPIFDRNQIRIFGYSTD